MSENQEYSPLIGPNGAELHTPQQIQEAVAAAAVRPEVSVATNPAREAARQAGIAAADRATREAAGLPPRVHNLR